jgi:hypothetical protein
MASLRTFADVLASPGSALAAVAQRRSILPPLILATAAALLLAAVLVPRVDWDHLAQDQIDRRPNAAQMTPHEREEAVTQIRKMGWVAQVAGSTLGPGLASLVVALALWLGFRVAGARPGFLPTLAVAAWSTVPGAIGTVLSVPAVARAEGLAPSSLPGLLPWNAAYYLPPAAAAPLGAAAARLDLFSVWTLGLLVVGMAAVAGTTHRRAAAVTVLLWLGLVAAGMAATVAGSAA